MSLLPYSFRWIVAVRNEEDDLTWDFYGIYGSEKSAQRKADQINRRLALASREVAYAYVARLEAGNVPAATIAKKAGAA